MKSLRKSLNGARDSSRLQISTPVPLPPVSKPPSAILPPQKVIRAQEPYRSQAPQELSFAKGDFFYVLRDVDDQGAWYEAHNPVTGARGLVPRDLFEEFSRDVSSVRTSQVVQKAPKPPPSRPSLQQPRTQVYYAIVMHDFVAERGDELDAKRGDAITVVAQSNREWFVAKPIGRLGRPGLIPVSFVEIHDPSTGKTIEDVDGLMDRGELPKVEDWKQAMFNYKQNSITLGVIDAPSREAVANSPYMPQNQYQQQTQSKSYAKPELETPAQSEAPVILPDGILLSADVVSFHYEMEEYWFRIDAIFQPYNYQSQNHLPPAKQLVLFRVYNDFYDFQVSLLDTFPREAGRQPPHPRMLPFMPGPAQQVDDALTATRRKELDAYMHGLCDLKQSGGRYILEHEVIRKFLSLKPGDVEQDVEPRANEISELFDISEQLEYEAERDDYASEVRHKMSQMRTNDDARSDRSEYDYDTFPTTAKAKSSTQHRVQPQANDRRPSDDVDYHRHMRSQSHKRHDSNSSFPTPSSTHSRSDSPYRDHRGSPNLRSVDSSASQSRWMDGAYQESTGSTTSTSSFRSSQPTSNRPSSGSNATSNFNTPPISAANPQTAFVKIKIFDRVADDLIAIRVHPKVTHAELMDKVQARLGGEVTNLRFRDSVTNTFVGLDTDKDLREWMGSTDKHVLFAD